MVNQNYKQRPIDVLSFHRSKSLDRTVVVPGWFRQKPADQCYIEKFLQSPDHPQVFALVSSKSHCINH